MSGLFVDNEGNRDWDRIWYHARSAFAVLLSIAVLLGAGYGVYKVGNDAYIAWRTTDDWIGSEGTADVMVTIPKDVGMTQMGYILYDAEVIKSIKAWKKAVAKMPSNKTVQAGRYKMRKQISAEAALEILTNPKNIQRTLVTIPEGLTLAEQFDRITKATKIPQKQLVAVTAKPTKLGLPAWSTGKAEGFLFPDTYEVDDSPNALELAQAMVKRFGQVSDEINFEDRAKQSGITPYQALIIASIAEKEVHGAKELGLVAGVLRNRLAKGMPLQLDSTVIYANGGKGRLTTTDAERAKQSPYNTYLNKGLPPGPISNPGKLALNAAVNPTKSDYLFFVVIDPAKGTTAFSKTWAEHQQNVKKFQAWCQAHPGKC